MPTQEEKLQQWQTAVGKAKDLIRDLVEKDPTALKDPLIRYYLWGIRRDLTGLDLEWGTEPPTAKNTRRS
jgi:hypothetical protein